MPVQVSPAVKIYMDRFKLQPNWGRKHDIDATVTDLDLWNFVLTHWGYYSKGKWKSYNPLNISGMLSEYERLDRKRMNGSSLSYGETLESRKESVSKPRREIDNNG